MDGAVGRGGRALGAVLCVVTAGLLMGASPPGRPVLMNGGGQPSTGGPQPPGAVETRQMKGTLGALCDTSAAGFDEDADDGVFVNDAGADDGAACDYVARAGTDGGGVGGRVFMPRGYGKGEEIYFAVRAKLDRNWVSPKNALKWMRYRVGRSYSTHVGFVNFLLNRPSIVGQTPYKFSTSLESATTSHYFGVAEQDDPRFGSYDVYEMSCVLDDVPVDRGGRGKCEFWLNGKLIDTMTHARTLQSASDQVHWVEFVGTFQPSTVPQTQHLWVDWVKVSGG